jgi:hypothetical protein
MRNRAVYLASVVFASVGAIGLFGFATKAAGEGKTKIAHVFAAIGLGMAWLCREFARARKEVGKRYRISDDKLIADDPREESLSLSRVASVVSDARSGFISLRDASGCELRRVHIDNPVVAELKAYCENQNGG